MQVTTCFANIQRAIIIRHPVAYTGQLVKLFTVPQHNINWTISVSESVWVLLMHRDTYGHVIVRHVTRHVSPGNSDTRVIRRATIISLISFYCDEYFWVNIQIRKPVPSLLINISCSNYISTQSQFLKQSTFLVGVDANFSIVPKLWCKLSQLDDYIQTKTKIRKMKGP